MDNKQSFLKDLPCVFETNLIGGYVRSNFYPQRLDDYLHRDHPILWITL